MSIPTHDQIVTMQAALSPHLPGASLELATLLCDVRVLESQIDALYATARALRASS